MWSYKIKGTTVLTADPNKYNRLPSLISKMRWNRIRLRNTQHWQVGSSQLLWHITQTEAKMKESNWRKEKGRCHSLGFISFSQNIKQKQNLPQHGGKREHGHFFLTTTKLIKTGPTVTGLIRMKKKESKRNSFYFILLNLHFGIQHKDTQKKKKKETRKGNIQPPPTKQIFPQTHQPTENRTISFLSNLTRKKHTHPPN